MSLAAPQAATRYLLALVTTIVILAGSSTSINADDLPDIGSPSDAILSRKIEDQIGRQVYFSLLQSGKVITDPEIQEYIQDTGMRLVAQAGVDGQRFQFFVIDDPVINAFALPGGYIGVHSGLLLATNSESELAGVLAHEISHVTQRHISRAVFANSRASTLSMAAMLGAILVGVATGADPGLIQGAVGATQGAAIERQISFTRSNEYEADRVGIGVLADAGFDPNGMPDFFETMGRQSGSLYGQAPEFLLTHPVSADRVAESRNRVKNYPLIDAVDSSGYDIARARIRLTVSTRPETALEFFEAERDKPDQVGSLEIDYGISMALIEMGEYQAAEAKLAALLANNEESIPLYSGLASAQAGSGDSESALATLEQASELFPRNIPLTVRHAEALLKYGDSQAAHEILLDLLNQTAPTQEQVRLIAIAANKAGDSADAHYYMAEFHAMGGSLRLAIEQLQLALASPNLDSVQRARFMARLRQFQDYLPERQGN
jgi:predicted Zn-dependent protease